MPNGKKSLSVIADDGPAEIIRAELERQLSEHEAGRAKARFYKINQSLVDFCKQEYSPKFEHAVPFALSYLNGRCSYIRSLLLQKDTLPSQEKDCTPFNAARAAFLISVLARVCDDCALVTKCLVSHPELYVTSCETLIPLEGDVHHISKAVQREQERDFRTYANFTVFIQSQLSIAYATYGDRLAQLDGQLFAHLGLFQVANGPTYRPGGARGKVQLQVARPRLRRPKWYCPICGAKAGVDSSGSPTDPVRVRDLACKNEECGHTWQEVYR